jgi:hypothetical protein
MSSTPGYVILPTDAAETGKKQRTVTDTVLGESVHSEVVVIADGSGNVIDPRGAVTAPTVKSVTATSSGDSIIWSPASGKKFRLRTLFVWNNGSADITVYFKREAVSETLWNSILVAKTGFTLNLIGANIEGAADADLLINLSGAGTVDVTATGEEA